MRSIGGVIVGEILELGCSRRTEKETTIEVYVRETRLHRFVRRLLRRSAPKETIPWAERGFERVPGKVWVVGTMNGPIATKTEARARKLAAVPPQEAPHDQ
jgi:hypothetical protein